MRTKKALKPHRTHDEATIESFRRDPKFAAAYLNAVLNDGDCTKTPSNEAAKMLRRLKRARPRVLSTKTRALAESIASDPKKSREFLEKAGIIGKDGKLTKHYR